MNREDPALGWRGAGHLVLPASQLRSDETSAEIPESTDLSGFIANFFQVS